MAVVRMWLSRKQSLARKKEANEAKRAMESKLSEEARVAETEANVKEDAVDDGRECIKEVASSTRAESAKVSYTCGAIHYLNVT